MKRKILAFGLTFCFAFPLHAQSEPPKNSEALLTIETPAPRPASASERLAAALQIPTVSTQDPSAFPHEAFDRLERYLERSFPLMHQNLKKEKHGQHGLLYKWAGSEADLKPVLFMAHQDVVPVPENEMNQWIHPPFSGKIHSGYIWGRGAIDVKSMLMALCETAEALLAQGYRPKRTLYFAFGQDEETGGKDGNQRIAAHLKNQGVTFEWIHDEGMVITDGVIEGPSQPVALIGIAEKGYVSLELTAPGMGGHSSMPPQETAVTKLAAAIVKIQNNPLEPQLNGPVRALFETLADHMPFPQSFLFNNLWLFDGLVTSQLASKDSTNALVRTTTAPTMISGSVKDNVLPTEAKAVINFRVHPNNSVQEIKDHIRNVIEDDTIKIGVAANTLYSEPSSISSTTSAGYQLIEQTLRGQYPKMHVAPALFIAATDSRHYRELTNNIYRFTPYWMTAGDRERIHGINERISVKNYRSYVEFFVTLVRATGLKTND